MKKQICLILIVLFAASSFRAQQLCMPRDVKAAYARGLRSIDGKPTQKYFQNELTHHIKISIQPPNRRVTGTASHRLQKQQSDSAQELGFPF